MNKIYLIDVILIISCLLSNKYRYDLLESRTSRVIQDKVRKIELSGHNEIISLSWLSLACMKSLNPFFIKDYSSVRISENLCLVFAVSMI